MAITSFVDDKSRYLKAYHEKDYQQLADENIKNREALSFYIYEKDTLYGYQINQNQPLAKLYEMPFFVVRFIFANVDTLHDDEQEKQMIRLLLNLKAQMEQTSGYYSIRIPSHIIDLIRAYNEVLNHAIFCGGTVEEYTYDYHVVENNNAALNLFFADFSYFEKEKPKILKIIDKSFSAFPGQYHISPVTAPKAGCVYQNWIAQSFDESKIVIAEINGEPVGFLSISENEYAVDVALTAVSPTSRKNGVYKAMLAYGNHYANASKRFFVVGTQFDNFASQAGLQSFGLKPYKSVYNIHVDNSMKSLSKVPGNGPTP